MNFGFILHIPIFCQMAWFNRLRIVPNQQTSNPFLKHFSGKYQAEKHIKTTKEVSRIFWYAQSGVQAASFRKHLLEMQTATLIYILRLARSNRGTVDLDLSSIIPQKKCVVRNIFLWVSFHSYGTFNRYFRVWILYKRPRAKLLNSEIVF